MTNIPIFLSADNNYAPFVATTIASICDNTKSFCDFYILDGGISEENKEKICELKNQFDNFSIEFIYIDVENQFRNYPKLLHFTKTMFVRFLIPQLKPNLKKVLYSDVDVIILKDIKAMINEDLDNYVIGAVPELFLGKSIKEVYQNTLSISEKHQPFASGNLIVDCEKWRENNITNKLLAIEFKQDKIQYTDQTLLNIYFDNDYKQLNQRYCYTIQHDVCLPSDDIVVCHYNGMVKPWHIDEKTDTKLIPHLKEFWHYANMTPFYDEIRTIADNTNQRETLNNLKLFRIMAKRNNAL